MLGAPIYSGLAALLAEDPTPATAILGDDASWDLGLRLFGAVHWLVLTGVAPQALSGDPRDFASALHEHAAELRRFVAEQGVQTNETQRCVGLLPAFLWPGLEERVSRLDAAIETLRRSPQRPELIRGDYVELLPRLLGARPADAVTIVFQTASTGYLSAADRLSLRAALDAAGADGRPLAWVSTRAMDEREHADDDSWELELRIWPAPARMVARLDYHGNWLDWIG